MSAILEWIKLFINGFLDLLKSFGYWLMDFLYPVLESILYFIFDSMCKLLEWFFALLDFKNELFDMSLAWTSIPPEMIWILNQTGFDNGLLIITSAIGIRLLLNLIPAALTRV